MLLFCRAKLVVKREGEFFVVEDLMKDVVWKAKVKTAQHVKSMLGKVILILMLVLILILIVILILILILMLVLILILIAILILVLILMLNTNSNTHSDTGFE